MILLDIKTEVNLPNPLLWAEYQDSSKSCKMRNLQDIEFSEKSTGCSLSYKFDIIMISCNILSSCKVVKPFLTAENQDSPKSYNMRNFANYKFI